jgi:poly [ADP-ribose] polymerase 2/3/4
MPAKKRKAPAKPAKKPSKKQAPVPKNKRKAKAASKGLKEPVISQAKKAKKEKPKASESKPEKTKSKKGARPKVDSGILDGYTFQVSESQGKYFACSLMWTDLKHNNNKYYIIQIVERKKLKKTEYLVFNKWGRVGFPGQSSSREYPALNTAIADYNHKYKQKTTKGYTEIEISYDDDANQDQEQEETKQPKGFLILINSSF